MSLRALFFCHKPSVTLKTEENSENAVVAKIDAGLKTSF